MWRIRQIFDGDYGCEELAPGTCPQVSITLQNKTGEERRITVADDWLAERNLHVGSIWPADRVILASQSPRRKELLHRIIDAYEIIPATGEETSDATDPHDYVRELSWHKAREVMDRVVAADMARNTGALQTLDAADPGGALYVIGSDTIVVCDDEIMGKPHDRDDAHWMIHRLQGRSHEVMTGVTILRRRDGAETSESYTCVTGVDVAPMDDAEIRRYLATGEADDKAGAYGIQGAFGIHVTGIRGSYSNVVGLPVAALYQSLRRMGLQVLSEL